MIVHNCEPYGDEWWKLRMGVPTASEFHRIITPKKWQWAEGASTYAAELIGQSYDSSYGITEGFESAAMRNGRIMEPESRRYYEMTREVEVMRVGFVVSDCGRFGYSPDSLCGDDGALELKNPQPATHIKWLLAGKIPDEHLAQCYGGLLVAKRKWIDFMSYCPRLPPLLVRLTPDDKMLKLAEALDKFWTVLSEMRAKVEGGEPSPIPGVKPQPAYF